MKREPAIIIAALAAVVQGVFIFLTNDVNADSSWLLPILTIVAGMLTRQKVTPTDKIRDAGISPTEITRRADNPSIPRYEGR